MERSRTKKYSVTQMMFDVIQLIISHKERRSSAAVPNREEFPLGGNSGFPRGGGGIRHSQDLKKNYAQYETETILELTYSQDIHDQLIDRIKVSGSFSIQLDESTDVVTFHSSWCL